MITFSNKIILVVGAKGLLGSAVCRLICDCGCFKLIEADLPEFDCCNPDSVLNFFVSTCVPDILINCAYPHGDKHLLGFMTTTEIAASRMALKGGGTIVNVASIYGVVGPKDEVYRDTDMKMPSSYAAAKGGIIAHSRCLATRYAKQGVRINCVSPGGIFDDQPESFVNAYSDRVPMGRMADEDFDIAGPILFLASDVAQYITGQNLIVDGGLTAW